MELDELEILNGDSTFFVERMNYIHFFLFHKLLAAHTNPKTKLEIVTKV